MNRYLSVIILAVALASCKNDNKVVITGIFSDKREGTVYLEQSDIDRVTLIDSAKIREGRVRFTTEVSNPEFYQIGTGQNDFVSLLALPGENIRLTFGKSPLIKNYKVEGSKSSEQVKELDVRLYNTKVRLDSLRKIYSSLSDAELSLRGPELEKQYTDAVNDQRKKNIEFILGNISSMASVKAVFQRLDENTYVLYQPRDLQFLKILSDTLSVRYPTSKHVIAIKDNLTRELNQMYLDRITSMATETTLDKIDPDLMNADGQRVKLSSLRGKYVLVSFWASTSETCLEEIAILKNLYKTYHSKGLEIYHVNLDADEARWKSVVKFEEIPWISVREDDPLNPAYASALNVRQLPSNLLYDRGGNIINSNLYGRNLQIRMDQLFNK